MRKNGNNRGRARLNVSLDDVSDISLELDEVRPGSISYVYLQPNPRRGEKTFKYTVETHFKLHEEPQLARLEKIFATMQFGTLIGDYSRAAGWVAGEILGVMAGRDDWRRVVEVSRHGIKHVVDAPPRY